MIVGYTVYWPDGREERSLGEIPAPSVETLRFPSKTRAVAIRMIKAVDAIVVPILKKELIAAEYIAEKMGVAARWSVNAERVRVIRSAAEPYRNGDEYLDMFVDEDSHGRERPRNEAATTIYRANALRQFPGTDPESLPWIAGPAVLFDRRVWF
jgi:hypothetical protein